MCNKNPGSEATVDDCMQYWSAVQSPCGPCSSPHRPCSAFCLLWTHLCYRMQQLQASMFNNTQVLSRLVLLQIPHEWIEIVLQTSANPMWSFRRSHRIQYSRPILLNAKTKYCQRASLKDWPNWLHVLFLGKEDDDKLPSHAKGWFQPWTVGSFHKEFFARAFSMATKCVPVPLQTQIHIRVPTHIFVNASLYIHTCCIMYAHM